MQWFFMGSICPLLIVKGVTVGVGVRRGGGRGLRKTEGKGEGEVG